MQKGKQIIEIKNSSRTKITSKQKKQ